nr:MAG TPA: hypothetical protein [Caudoviricetes sp.]
MHSLFINYWGCKSTNNNLTNQNFYEKYIKNLPTHTNNLLWW